MFSAPFLQQNSPCPPLKQHSGYVQFGAPFTQTSSGFSVVVVVGGQGGGHMQSHGAHGMQVLSQKQLLEIQARSFGNSEMRNKNINLKLNNV